MGYGSVKKGSLNRLFEGFLEEILLRLALGMSPAGSFQQIFTVRPIIEINEKCHFGAQRHLDT